MTASNGTQYFKYYFADSYIPFRRNHWDPEAEGTIADSLKPFDFYSTFQTGTNHQWARSLPSVLPTEGIPQYSFIISSNEPDGKKFISGCSINLKDLAEPLQSLLETNNMRIAYTTPSGRLVYETGLGAILPTFPGSSLTPYYPTFAEANLTVFNTLNSIDADNYEIIEHDFDGNTIIFSKAQINTSYSTQVAVVYIACNFTTLLAASFAQTSLFFVASFSFVLIIFFVFPIIIHSNTTYTIKRLHKKHMAKVKTELIVLCGTIGKAISHVRQLELSQPEEVLLNKALDTAVLHLTQHQDRAFSNNDTQCTCSFCKYLIPKELDFPRIDPSISYSTWLQTTSACFPDIPEFCAEDLIDNQPWRLLQTVVDVLRFEKLLIPWLDPDVFLDFVLEFSQNLIDLAHITLSIDMVSWYLRYVFQEWVANRYYLLSMLMAMLAQRLRWPPNDEEIAREAQQFPDDMTRISLKVRYIRKLFKQRLNAPDDFLDLVEMNIRKIDDMNTLELLSALRIRMESPEFSVFANADDSLLFLQGVAKFSEFVEYFVPNKDMVKLLTNHELYIFTPQQRADRSYVATYYYEVSSKIVIHWFHLFRAFNELDVLSMNLEQNIAYWNSKRDSTSE